jgi:diaminopimelate epimerase
MDPAIRFWKMSGCGNDFIVIDHRRPLIAEGRIVAFVRRVCRRRVSVGADGLILVEADSGADFRWRFYNADGSRAEMCGNGARCAARFAHLIGIAGPRLCFATDAGLVRAEVQGAQVAIALPDPGEVSPRMTIEAPEGQIACRTVHTGVPHAVIVSQALETLDVVGLGRPIRHHPHFAPQGVNVNFIQPLADGSLAIRTYERGVEEETLACGTGSAAAALVMAAEGRIASPARLMTRGGPLEIRFTHCGGRFTGLSLAGDARVVYAGELHPEALEG